MPFVLFYFQLLPPSQSSPYKDSYSRLPLKSSLFSFLLLGTLCFFCILWWFFFLPLASFGLHHDTNKKILRSFHVPPCCVDKFGTADALLTLLLGKVHQGRKQGKETATNSSTEFIKQKQTKMAVLLILLLVCRRQKKAR